MLPVLTCVHGKKECIMRASKVVGTCRELNGRGALSWVRTTSWWQQLQEQQGRVLGPGVQRVQVELLGGQVVLLEADVNATICQFRDAIEEEVGIVTGQQRLICVGEITSCIVLSELYF